MAADMNRVTLVGRLTRDPELRATTGGTSIASIRLAVTSRAKASDGTWADAPNYFDVTVFGRQAESAAQYLAKGLRCGVDGRLQWREWTDRDGARRQSVEVVAQDVFFFDFAQQDGATPAARAAHVDRPADEDIPF